MWDNIRTFAVKCWEFLKRLFRSSVKLFQQELKEKRINLAKMSPRSWLGVLKTEVVCFFASGVKSLAESGLRTKHPKLCTIVQACSLPYDASFRSEENNISILSCVSTLTNRCVDTALNDRHLTLADRTYFNLNFSQISSLLT